MFERFTEKPRYVATLAAMNAAGEEVTVDDLALAVEKVKAGEVPPTVPRKPFAPQSKKVFELALRDALAKGHNYIGLEHIEAGIEKARAL